MILMLACLYICVGGNGNGANFHHTSEWGSIMSESEAINEIGGPVVRTGAGRRSIQVEVYNNVDATLTINGVTKANDAEWIDDEKPKIGDSLSPQSEQTWGLDNADSASITVEATVQLIGDGDSALRIRFYNMKNGTSGVDPAENEFLIIKSQKLASDDKAHARFRVDINAKVVEEGT